MDVFVAVIGADVVFVAWPADDAVLVSIGSAPYFACEIVLLAVGAAAVAVVLVVEVGGLDFVGYIVDGVVLIVVFVEFQVASDPLVRQL